jgi:thymidylate synthase (FAD)
MLDSGICPEQARMVLPQNTMTEWRWSGTLGAFLDMLVLRLNSHTQKETRDVAEKIAVIVKELFPVSYAAYLGE